MTSNMEQIMKILDGIIETKMHFLDIQQYDKVAKWRKREWQMYEEYGKDRILLWRKLRKIKKND